MPVKGARRPTVKHPVLSDMLGERVNQFLINEYDDQMIERAKNALLVNPFMMEFYSKKMTGRRCSCFGIDDTPDGLCVSCFGQGIVGGYDKYTCHTDMIELSTNNLELVNVLPDFKSRRVPVPLQLIKTATMGYIEATIKLEPNVGLLDLWKVHAFEPAGTSVQVFVRTTGDSSWIPANNESVNARLNCGVLKVRVVMSRANPNITAYPYLKAIRLRYQTMEGSKQVRVNSPVPEVSQQLQDMGIWETFQSLQLFTDDTLSVIHNDDLFRNSRNNTAWKVISVKENNVSGRTLNWLVNSRLLQPFDSQHTFPF